MASRWPYSALIFAFLVAGCGIAWAAEGPGSAPSEFIFIAQLVLLILLGRLLGEVMQRIGQPAVMGMLIAGILLGPSVLGALWPDAQHLIFPKEPGQKAMIDGGVAARHSDAAAAHRDGDRPLAGARR